MTGRIGQRAALWAAAAAAFGALARGLPPETFFVGDPGVKLIAARQAHPDRPLEVPLPTIAGEPVPYVEPFFAVHGGHSHAVTSELFPLLSSPFIARLGARGAYVLPALGFFLYLAAAAPLAMALGCGGRAAALLAAGLGTPLLFYGLEFWEHAPAVGVATLGLVWLLGAGNHGPRRRALVAGFLFGIAILLRPEAIWFVAAVAVASRLLPDPPAPGTLAALLAGALLTASPLLVYSVTHFGTILPPHAGSQSALVTQDWLPTRLAIVGRWFGPDAPAVSELWGVALLAMLACGRFCATCLRRTRGFLTSVALIDIALVVLTAPNDGGGQWGPRYLLFAFVPAALLAAGCLEELWKRRGVLTIATTVVAVGLGVWAQRDGYRQLRSAKLVYGRILDFVREEVPRDGFAVTDLWWLDQVAAAATADRQILFAATPSDARALLERLGNAGIGAVTLVYSRTESPEADRLGGACYLEAGRREIPERALVAIRLRQCR